ncbi:MAG: hypothetical protein RIC87_01125 [Kiloniellales bacterium]
MGKWVMIGLAILLAIAISLVWLGTAAYLLGDVWNVVDPARFALPMRVGALIAVAVVPVMVWLLASSVWRSNRFNQMLRRIEGKVTAAQEAQKEAQEAQKAAQEQDRPQQAQLQAEIVALKEATETATRQIGEAAAAAEIRRSELVEVAEPMAELAGHLHGVLGDMRAFGERVETTEGSLRALVGHVASLKDAAEPLMQLDDRLTKEQRRLMEAIRQLTESGEAAVSNLQQQARSLRDEAGSLKIAPPRLTDARQVEAKGLRRVDFLADARDVVAHLNDKAVELNSLMKVETPAEVREALKAGDYALLLRRLPRLKDRSGRRGLVLHYRHDNKFKAVADRFMEGFEALLEDSREADPTGGMSALFVTSDLGRLYLVLAGETGRGEAGLLD